MSKATTPQLTLHLTGDPPPAPAKQRQPPKPHHRPKADGPFLPDLPTKRYLPVVGVPTDRKACPDTTHQHCPHLRCRWHLHRLDADSRAGRPGLAHVPRDARGLTLSAPGHAGHETAGTTAIPRWLELERYCKVYVEPNEEGTAMLGLTAVYEGEADLFFERLHVGEAIDVMDGEYLTGQETLPRVMGATLTHTGSIKFEKEPVGLVQSYVFTLRRVRGVPSCALDEIRRRGKMSNEQTGDAIGRHRTLVARELKNAIEKAKGIAEEMGMDSGDLMAALMQMGNL